ncbi:UNVERIFIED_CONTAM: hypothetical protein Sradi_5226900 [Sesamum radiatum]|uniref:Uncharacterized protein n=1 Tax=Sesamum radiatum TaxID=300843 RepID=A0AAW2LKF1_SESRA
MTRVPGSERLGYMLGLFGSVAGFLRLLAVAGGAIAVAMIFTRDIIAEGAAGWR